MTMTVTLVKLTHLRLQGQERQKQGLGGMHDFRPAQLCPPKYTATFECA